MSRRDQDGPVAISRLKVHNRLRGPFEPFSGLESNLNVSATDLVLQENLAVNKLLLIKGGRICLRANVKPDGILGGHKPKVKAVIGMDVYGTFVN